MMAAEADFPQKAEVQAKSAMEYIIKDGIGFQLNKIIAIIPAFNGLHISSPTD